MHLSQVVSAISAQNTLNTQLISERTTMLDNNTFPWQPSDELKERVEVGGESVYECESMS